MTSVTDIAVQPTNDPNVRVYHTRFEMVEKQETGARGNSDSVGEFGNIILQIRGVSNLVIEPYILMVGKAPLFEWYEIDPKIQEILKEFCRSQNQIVDAYLNPAPPEEESSEQPTVAVDRVKRSRTTSTRAPREARET